MESLLKTGKTAHGSFLYIKHKQNELPYPRLAVVVPKKVEKTAVKRNNIRRVIYAFLRKSSANIPTGLDMAVFLKQKDTNGAKEELLNVISKISNH